MRVACLVHDFPKLSETFILNQITGLIERGHHVDIYTNRIHDGAEAHPDVEKFNLWGNIYQLPDTPTDLIPRLLLGLWLLLRHWHRHPAMFGRALNPLRHGFSTLGLRLVYPATILANKAPYDVIHSQFATQSFTGLAFAQVLYPQPKVVVACRGYDISTDLRQLTQGNRDRLFRDVDFFLANCEFFRQKAIELGCNPAKVRVHRSGLDCTKFAYSPRRTPVERGGHLVTTGRLVEKKGIEYVIRAVAQLLPKYPDLQYSIIGDGSRRESLQQLVESLQLDDAVHLLGWKNEQQIAEILRQGDLFIAPSVTAANGNQDAPINVLKEAMAMGMPVVSTWHGGIPELIEHGVNGLLVPERDVDALVEQIDFLLQNPDRWDAMARAGRATVERDYNLHRLNDQLVELYQVLTDAAQPSAQPSPQSLPLPPLTPDTDPISVVLNQ